MNSQCVDVLTNLIYAPGINAAVRSEVTKLLSKNDVKTGYSRITARIHAMGKSCKDGWPTDNIPQALDLTKPITIRNRTGVVFKAGGRGVANMLVNICKVANADGKLGLEANLEISLHGNDSVVKTMLEADAKFEDVVERSAAVDSKGRLCYLKEQAINALSGKANAGYALTLETPEYKIQYFPEETSQQALRGTMRVRGFGKTQAEQRANLAKGFEAAGAQEVLRPCKAQNQRLHLNMRLLWQADPKTAYELSQLPNLTDSKVNKALVNTNVSPSFIKNVRYSEVSPGYFTGVVPGQGELYANYGVQALVHQTSYAKNVVDIVLGGGLICTTERMARGIHIAGLSSDDDMNTGGADYVFTRLLMADENQNLDGFNLVMKTKLLDRTDWFAYEDDNFGSTTIVNNRGKASTKLQNAYKAALLKDKTNNRKVAKSHGGWDINKGGAKHIKFDELHADFTTTPFVHRATGKEFLELLHETGDTVENEVMFRNGISLTDIDHVVVNRTSKRKSLLKAFKQAGITQINGSPAASFVRLGHHDAPPQPLPLPDNGNYI
jgi:hypothetical protein